MKRILLALVAVAAVAAAAGSVVRAGPGLEEDASGRLASLVKQDAVPGAGSQPKKEKKASRSITAEGTLTPLKYGKLGFKMAGRVAEVPLQAGGTFEAGQPIARLDSAELEMAVQAALDGLRMAQALEEQLRQSARPENAQIAEDNLQAAEARLAHLKSGPGRGADRGGI